MRRWIVRVSVSLGVGLVLTVAVAWAAAMMLPAGPHSDDIPTKNRGYIGSVPKAFGEPTRAFLTRSPYACYWQVQWDGPDENDRFSDDSVAHVYRFGFPFLALETQGVYVPPKSPLHYDGPARRGAIPMPPWRSRIMLVRTQNTQYSSDLPWLPIWSGLIPDTILYASVALLVCLALAHRRRRKRLRRGLCPSCAYDLTGLDTCPECAWKRPPPQQAPGRPTE